MSRYYKPNSNYNESFLSKHIIAFGVAALFLVAAFIVGWVNYGTSDDVTITVTRLDDQATTDGHKYLVFTKDEVFENTDSLLYFKWNSSDVQNSLQEGHTYDCHVNLFRSGFLSAYRNILSCDLVR